jgi:hypothetical protein
MPEHDSLVSATGNDDIIHCHGLRLCWQIQLRCNLANESGKASELNCVSVVGGDTFSLTRQSEIGDREISTLQGSKVVMHGFRNLTQYGSFRCR